MQALEGVKRQIHTAEDLQNIVKTMKALAAVSIRQFERAVASLADYQRTIDLGLQAVLRHEAATPPMARSAPDGCLGAVVFGSDQGLCGRFNDQIAFAALDTLPGLEPRREWRYVHAVGSRVAARLEGLGESVAATSAVPASLAGITPMVQNLLLHLETWREQTHIDRIVLMHHTPLSGPSYSPHLVHLLPIDLTAYQQRAKWPSRSLPAFTLRPRQLLSSLLRQRVFVCLYRAFAESLACENAGRLASMQAAERNIADHLEALRAQYRYQRQHAITAELLDIVSGYEALQGVAAVDPYGISPLRVPL
jgi:F-type H+-transporting ATPase subunit gamma